MARERRQQYGVHGLRGRPAWCALLGGPADHQAGGVQDAERATGGAAGGEHERAAHATAGHGVGEPREGARLIGINIDIRE